MNPQEILNRNLQCEIGKLVMEIAVLKTQAEMAAEAQKSSSVGEAHSGSPNGAQGADGSGAETTNG